MAPFEAKSIIEALAFGKNPVSGETLGEQSVFHYPLVIRALFVAADSLGPAKRADAPPPVVAVRKPKPAPVNAGLKWTAEQEADLLAAFDRGVQVKEIAGQLGRTRASITARLVRLGRMTEEPLAAPSPAPLSA
jgi:hypothetical protein